MSPVVGVTIRCAGCGLPVEPTWAARTGRTMHLSCTRTVPLGPVLRILDWVPDDDLTWDHINDALAAAAAPPPHQYDQQPEAP